MSGEIRKKILILSDDFPPKSGGGAAVIAYNHAVGMSKEGYEVTVLTTVEERVKAGTSTENGIKIIRLYSKYSPRLRSYLSLINPFLIRKIKKIIKEEKADIIHAHNIHYHLSYHSLKIAKKYSKALFITIHDSMPFHYSKLFPRPPYDKEEKDLRVSAWRQLKDFKFRFNPFRNILIRHYLKIPNKIIAVSEALKKALNDNGIGNVEVMYNGIDLEKWKKDGEGIKEFKNKYNLNDKKVILFCGRLSRAKGGEVLIKILPNIIKAVPKAILLIVGEKNGNALNLLEKAREFKIESNIVFTGKLTGNELINAYGASNLLVSPSLCFDWFPTVNLEAMAIGLPVAATCFGGSKEVIEDGESGYVINPYDGDELSQKIINLLSNEDKMKEFGLKGSQIIQDNFVLSKYIQKYINCYNSSL